MSDQTPPKITRAELERRMLFAMVRPAARLAVVFGMSLHELREWVDLALLYEVKGENKTLKEIASQLDVSRRTVSMLYSKLKVNFLAMEQHEGLTRRLEFMLWSGSMTQGRIYQSMPDVERELIDQALNELVEQERVVREGGRTVTYAVPRRAFRLYRDNWLAKIDGLNNHMQNVANTAFARFFYKDERAFERTLNFRVRQDDLPQLEVFYREHLFPFLASLDTHAADDDDAQLIDLSINWAPASFIEQTNYPEDNEDNNEVES